MPSDTLPSCRYIPILSSFKGDVVGMHERPGNTGKGKGHRCAGTEALYRPYGP